MRARGDYRYDEFQREMVLMVNDPARSEERGAPTRPPKSGWSCTCTPR